MSTFQLPKSNGRISKKEVSVGITAAVLKSISPASTATSSTLVNQYASEPVVSKVVVEGEPVSFTQDNLDTIPPASSAGQAQGNKILLLDSNGSIANLNEVNCTSITVGEVAISTNTSNIPAAAPSNDYLLDTTPGAAKSARALVAGTDLSISANEISANSLGGSVAYKKEPSIGCITQADELTGVDWSAIAWSVDLNFGVCVGNSLLATVTLSGDSGVSVVLGESTLNLKTVVWCSWLGSFVANGPSGTFKSSDGVNWNVQSNAGGVVFTDMITYSTVVSNAGSSVTTYGIAASAADACLFSANGTSWTSIAVAGNWASVAVSTDLNRLVMVGTNIRAVTQLSSLSSTSVFTSGVLTGQWSSVSCSSSGFVAMSIGGVNTSRMTHSVNGVDWVSPTEEVYNTSSDLGLANLPIRGIKYFPERDIFFAITDDASPTAFFLFYSKDGLNWFPYRTEPSNRVIDIDYDPKTERFVLLTGGFSQPSGLTGFKPATCSGNTGTAFSRAFQCNNIAYVSRLGRALYSKDCKRFDLVIYPSTISDLREIAYSPTLNKYVGVGAYTGGGSGVCISDDGIVFTHVDVTPLGVPFSVSWFPNYGRFVIVCTSIMNLMTSTNGLSWDTLASPAGLVSTTNGIIVNVPGFGLTYRGQASVKFAKLNDTPTGITTTLSNLATSSSLTHGSIAYANNRLFVLGTDGSVYSSTDGVNFTLELPANSNQIGITLIPELNTVAVNLVNGSSLVYNTTSSTWDSVSAVSMGINLGASCYVPGLKMRFCIAGHVIGVSRRALGGIATSIRNDKVGSLTFQSDPNAVTSVEAIDRVSVAMASRLVYSSSDLVNAKVYFSRKQGLLIRFGAGLAISASSNGSTFTQITSYSANSIVEVGSRFYGVNGGNFVSFNATTLLEYTSVSGIPNLFMKGYGNMVYYHNAGVISRGSVYVGSTTVANSAINLVDFAVKPLTTISTASADIFVGVSATGISFGNEFNTMSIVQSGDFRIVEYFPTLDMFVAGGVNQVGLSKDGVTWELVPSGQPVTWMCFRYVPELRCIVAGGGNGLVGCSVDGRYWRTTLLSNITSNVLSIDYVASHGTFAVAAGASGRFTDIVELSRTRLQIATNSYFRNNKLVMFPAATLTVFREPTHVLETNNDILLTDGTTASTFLSISNSGVLTTLVNEARNLNIVNHNGSSTGLCLSGNLITASATNINNILRGSYATNGKNVFLEMNKYGTIVCKSLDCTSLNLQPVNEASGVLVCNSKGALSVDSIESASGEIDLGSCVIVDKSIPSSSIWQYPMVVARESETISAATRAGIAYSPTLDMYIAVFVSSSRYNALISVDGGKTWIPNSNIHNAAATTAVTPDTRNHFAWVSTYNAFILASGGMLRYSYDGYNWFGVTVPYGVAGHIFFPPTGGIGVCASNICTVAPGLDFTVAANWVTQFTTTIWRSFDWSVTYNRYLGISNSLDGIYSSTSLTVNPTRLVVYTSVTSFTMFGSDIYTAANGVVYKKSDVATSTGSTVLTLTGSTLTNLKAHDANNISVCSSINGDTYYSTNAGNAWDISAAGPVNKGVNASNGLSYHLLKNGNTLIWTFRSSILLSGKFAPKQTYSARSLENIASNKIGGDGLVNTSLYSNMFFYRKAVAYQMEAIAYNGSKTSPKYLIAGLDTVMTCPRLKYQHLSTITTVTGAWLDALWDSVGNRWLIMSSVDVMSSVDGVVFTSTGGGLGGLNLQLNPSTGMFVMATPSGYAYSSDCSSWTSVTLDGTWNNVKYDANAKTWVLCGLNKIAYAVSGSVSSPWTVVSLDGNWRDAAFGKNIWSLVGDGCTAASVGGFQKLTLKPRTTFFSGVLYCINYKRFYAFSSTSNVLSLGYNTIQSSLDGIHWMSNFYPGESHTTVTNRYSMRHLYFFEDTMQFAAPLSPTSGGGLDYLMCTDYADAGTTQLVAERLTMNVRNNCLEIGNTNLAASVSKNLSVYADSAAKPGTSTWTITSDERVKEDIQPADLDICYDVVKNIPLHYYKWNDDFVKSMNVVDNHKLGWFAQDVQSVFPKAVEEMEEPFLGIDKCLTLQTDQLIASMWGCIQKLDKQIKQLEESQD